MNRRKFLKGLGITAAASAIIPKILLSENRIKNKEQFIFESHNDDILLIEDTETSKKSYITVKSLKNYCLPRGNKASDFIYRSHSIKNTEK